MISDINKFAMVTQDSANQHFKRQSNQQFTSVNSLINSNLQRPSHDCNQNNTSHPSTYKPSSIWVQPDPSLTSIYSLWLQGSPPYSQKQTRQQLSSDTSSNWFRLPACDFGCCPIRDGDTGQLQPALQKAKQPAVDFSQLLYELRLTQAKSRLQHKTTPVRE